MRDGRLRREIITVAQSQASDEDCHKCMDGRTHGLLRGTLIVSVVVSSGIAMRWETRNSNLNIDWRPARTRDA